jgi:hypothetical protein
MDSTNKTYSYSQHGSFKLIANHGEKIFYFLVIIGVLFTYEDLKGQFLIDVILLMSGIFLLFFIIGKFVAKIIWRIDVDFNEEIISLNLCRKSSPIVIGFSDIDQIKVSGPIVFFVGNRKYYYSTNQYKEILKTLHNVKNITWGKMCDILGPEKAIRDMIDGN